MTPPHDALLETLELIESGSLDKMREWLLARGVTITNEFNRTMLMQEIAHAALARETVDTRAQAIDECLALVDRYGFASVFMDGKGGGLTLRQALMKLKDRKASQPRVLVEEAKDKP